ncbi:MAG TPA: EAL domain-containing protein, partial [Planctomycetes bacterium]|nr:EAL domain-containing protein [Planctomycetota bacterium]
RDVDGVVFGRQLAAARWRPDDIQNAQQSVIDELRTEFGRPLPEKMRIAAQTFLSTTLAGYSHSLFIDRGHVNEATEDDQISLLKAFSRLGSWSWDVRSKDFFGDESFQGMHGASRDAQISSREQWLERIHPQDVEKVSAETLQLLISDKLVDIEYRVLLPDSEVQHLNMQAEVVRDSAGSPCRLIGVCRDATDTVRLRTQLEGLSRIDPLTGSLNRRGLRRSIKQEVERRKRNKTEIQALFIDLDDFKRINDVYGHSTGDEVLRNVSKHISDAVRATDHVARLGGDEFMVLLPDTDRAAASVVAEKLYETLSTAVVAERFPHIRISLSMGLVSANKEDEAVADFIERTERALHSAKRMGKGRIIHEDSLFDNGSSERLTSEEMIKRLRQPDSYFALRQPIIKASDRSVVGYELLTRSSCPGLNSPEDFLQFAKDVGIVNLVDMNAFKVCTRAARTLRPAQLCHINILPSSLEFHMAEEILSMLPQGERLSNICIELSERELVQKPDRFAEMLIKLRAAGLKIALDDVGNGFSSLETMLLVRPEVVKIDRALVSKISQRQSQRNMLFNLMQMTATWDAVIVAEGVEEEEDFNVLQELGVDYVQGYLFGLPEPLDK